ncbi:precorrin-2 dehydrogenase/sirohydrochlorin ferrochelatase family protein [Paenibacillus thermotolerans]|uniref:precorrin-2 dehydrogenase/sirohydrochlorin ferrochelatase family protein n=1 Tax=Paenibacillus thermotolerans TaxID=3027807 RepID=UPI002367F66A|nr:MULTISPECIES: NAD(P)-dependent oxidoreductase [unclassified Paenibacillus]
MNRNGQALYPVMLLLGGKRCVVVGGGRVGWRRAEGLLAAGASVVVIAPEGTAELAAAAAQGLLEWHRRPYRSGDLDGALLAFAAAEGDAVNAAVAEEARRCGVLLSAANDSASCDFYVPSVVRRGSLTLSVSTGGASPKLAKRIASELKESYGSEYEAYTELLMRLRKRLQVEVPDAKKRYALLERLLDLDLPAKLRAGGSVEDAEKDAWDALIL